MGPVLIPFTRDAVENDAGDHVLTPAGHRIPLAFARHPRARRYVLRLLPNGRARVTIPRGGSSAEARRFAERCRWWLDRQFQRLANRPARPVEWSIGTEILFRGVPGVRNGRALAQAIRRSALPGCFRARSAPDCRPANRIEGFKPPLVRYLTR